MGMKRSSLFFTSLRLLLCGGSLSALMVSCVSLEKAAPPVSQLTLPKGTNTKKLEEGRAILADSCTQCHGAPQVSHHGSDEKWTQEILPKMTKKADLTDAQAELVKEYILAARKSMGASS
jgi:mono/diheme cytochrome c family protein